MPLSIITMAFGVACLWAAIWAVKNIIGRALFGLVGIALVASGFADFVASGWIWLVLAVFVIAGIIVYLIRRAGTNRHAGGNNGNNGGTHYHNHYHF